MTVSLSDVLYDGEDVVARVDFDGNALVATTHRVIALTPDGDGERVRHADRPNVEDVRIETPGETGHLVFGVKQTVLAVFLLGLGTFVSLDGLADDVTSATSAAREVGFGGIADLFGTVGFLATVFDDAMVLVGVLAATLALVGYARYLHSRTRALVVETYGGDELRVPAPDADEADVGRVLEALH